MAASNTTISTIAQTQTTEDYVETSQSVETVTTEDVMLEDVSPVCVEC
jgi:hypothetical protein